MELKIIKNLFLVFPTITLVNAYNWMNRNMKNIKTKYSYYIIKLLIVYYIYVFMDKKYKVG